MPPTTPLVTVVIGADPAAIGAAVDELEGQGFRAAGFVGDPATEQPALVEMLAELFPMPNGPDDVETA